MPKCLLSTLIVSTLIGVSTVAIGANSPGGDALSLPAAVVELNQNDLTSTKLTIRAPEIGRFDADASNGSSVERYGLEGEVSTCLPGWPELPMISRMVLVPPTSGIEVRINHIDVKTEPGIIPFITPAQDGSENVDVSAEGSPEFLNFEGFWPTEPVVVSKPAILRGHRLVQVTIYPVQVNPRTGELRYNDNIEFELAYTGVGENIVVNPERPRPSGSINRLLESMVVNPPPARRDQGGVAGRGSYLLVYYNANGIANSLAPLITWRKRMGWDVRVIAAQVNASADAIKQQIQTAYNEWENPPEMIALVGDPDWAGNGVPGWGNYTDLTYARLEGNDILADADYGRISCGTIQELDRVVAKIINYESNPFMDNTDWYRQGSVCAGSATSGLSTILVNKWVRRETMDRGWTSVDEWYFGQGQGDVPSFFENQFRRGISYATYRGWIGMEGLDANRIMNFQAHRRYPFAPTMTCQSGHYQGQFCQTEAFFRSAGGAIGSIGFATASTHVQYNNAVFSGIWVGLLRLDMFNIGTACNYGRYEVYRQYHGFEEQNVTNFSEWANLMGDPATEMFTKIPTLISVDYPANIPIGNSNFQVTVTEREGGDPVADAYVCLFKAADNLQIVVRTDENGVATFAVPPDGLTAGDLMVTVTKHNVKAFLGNSRVGQAEEFLGASSWEISEDNDNDGVANPGEQLSLTTQIKNFGSSRPDGQVTLTAVSLSPWAVVNGDPVVLDTAPAVGQESEAVFNLTIDPSAPNKTAIPIAIEATVGETVMPSMAAIEVVAPKVRIAEIFLPNNRINPGEMADIDISLSNIGDKQLEVSGALLFSGAEVLTVVQNESSYPVIAAGRSARVNGARFRIRAHPFTIPGMTVPISLAIQTEAGFCDTAYFQIRIGQPRETDPFGPDKYGYVCFDSGDRDWEMAPVYDWIEIDPNDNRADFRGTLLNLQDGSEDQDRSMVIDLPFEFQYYGEMFNRLTICTNGWAAFGNWGELTDFRNRRINSGECANGQLCVFWDDLMTGRIIVHHDRQEGRFIVEWNNMTSAGGGNGQTFELILYDVAQWPTYSGDGVIAYQYKTISNPNGAGPSNDTPYATIGINSPSDMDGLEYTYYNSYTPGARRIGNELAIKFTTAIQYITGVLAINVVDAATGNPIEDVNVATDRGFRGETDADGNLMIDDILIGHYGWISYNKPGYNDSTWTGFEENGFDIAEGETLWVFTQLLHPEFNLIGVEDYDFMMKADSITSTSFTISNDGNGWLSFTSKFTYVIDEEGLRSGGDDAGPTRGEGRDDPDEMWDPLLNVDVSQQIDNLRVQGVAFVRDHWVVSAGHFGNEDTLNYFYEFSRNGEYTGNRMQQPIGGSYGLRDMEYYDGYLYCTYTEQSFILKVDPATGEEVRRWIMPRGFNNPRNLTIDPATGHIWASGITTRIFELEITDSDTLRAIQNHRTTDPRTAGEMHEYGITWFRDDPDGFNIYMMSDDEVEDDTAHANIAVFKMNPVTGETRFLTDLPSMPHSFKGRCGITITPKWNNMVWAMGAVFDDPGGDHLAVFEVAPNSSWIDYTPRADTLNATDQTSILITLETAELDTGRYGVVIQFNHNASGGRTEIPVVLEVVSELPDVYIDPNTAQPFEYSLETNFPNPFNSSTLISYSLKSAGKVRLEVFDLQGRLVNTLVDGQQPAGKHRLMLEAGDLSAGLYIYRLSAGEFTGSRKMLLIK
jgi:hypothetical protein